MKTPLPNQPIRQLTRFESCDSTNRLLLDAADAGISAGAVFVAREQTAGRGRRGRHWIAAPGDSLTFSLLWTFAADPAKLSGLSLVVGLAVVQALSAAALGTRRSQTRAGLKWPNDILVARADGSFAKAGGVLIESAMRPAAAGGKELAVVIGIGLNCAESTSVNAGVADQSVATLSELFERDLTPEILLPVLLDALFETLDTFGHAGFAGFRAAWNTQNLWQDQFVQVKEGATVLHEGICRGVDDAGALCIETVDGMTHIVSGDVSLRKV